MQDEIKDTRDIAAAGKMIIAQYPKPFKRYVSYTNPEIVPITAPETNGTRTMKGIPKAHKPVKKEITTAVIESKNVYIKIISELKVSFWDR